MHEPYPTPVTADPRVLRRRAAHDLLVAAAALWLADEPDAPGDNPWSVEGGGAFLGECQRALVEVHHAR